MNRREMLNQLLEDMDEIRPIVIAAMPEDLQLRSTTRRMISDLEQIRHHPGIPDETHQWICKQYARLLDAEHGAMLRTRDDGTLAPESVSALQSHTEQRQMLLMQAQTEMPATHQQLDDTTALIGEKARRRESLIQRARHLDCQMRAHLHNDAGLKQEMKLLIGAFAPSLAAISDLLDKTGGESSELKQAMQILEQGLPDDINQARDMLHRASKSIHSAGSKLVDATEKLNETIREHTQNISNMNQQLQRAENEARNDPLTGLSNRRRLAEFLRGLGQSEFCFLVVDVDHFKQINDTYGHDAGDEILQQLAKILSECIRQSDLAARIGGEEFCIIFPGTELAKAEQLAESLRRSIEVRSFSTNLGNIDITVSIGVAAHQPGTEHAITFKQADTALYKAKKSGRNRVIVSPPPQQKNPEA